MAKSKRVRDWAKVFTGLVLGDLLGIIWFLSSDILPVRAWGITVTEQTAYLGIVFNIFLLVMLIHYAWHPKALEPTVSMRSMFFVVGVLTGLIAVVHALRIVFGWHFTLGSWQPQMWLSWVMVIITAYISYASFHFMGRK